MVTIDGSRKDLLDVWSEKAACALKIFTESALADQNNPYSSWKDSQEDWLHFVLEAHKDECDENAASLQMWFHSCGLDKEWIDERITEYCAQREILNYISTRFDQMLVERVNAFV